MRGVPFGGWQLNEQFDSGLGSRCPGQTLDHGEAGRTPGPVAFQRTGACAADHRAQDQGHDNDIVGIADDRQEIRDQVDGHQQISQQQEQPHADSTRKAPVGGQAAQEGEQVWQQSKGFPHAHRFGVSAGVEGQQDQQHGVDQSYPADNGNYGLPPVHTVASSALLVDASRPRAALQVVLSVPVIGGPFLVGEIRALIDGITGKGHQTRRRFSSRAGRSHGAARASHGLDPLYAQPMGAGAVADDLLSGPRGRRFCLSILTSARTEMWTLAVRSAMSPADNTLLDALTEALGSPDSMAAAASAGDRELLAGFAEAVDGARYWQEPDETDVLLVRPPVHAALMPVADALSNSVAASWWASPVALDGQCFVQWTDEHKLQPPALAGASGNLDRWRAATLADERQAADRPRDPAASWSGRWWSAPVLSDLVTTTRSLPGLGAAKLMLVEDSFGWKRARVWPLKPAAGSRVYEITGPAAWTDLVARYPMDVTLSKRHDWWRTTGVDGTWLMPDWSAVASDYDAVHLTAFGYLTTAGRPLFIGSSGMVLAGWNPDETYWLADVLSLAAPFSEWQREDSHPSKWKPADTQ